ncbi:uncharacterized protein LOC135098478 [Scylla paramamosain]|uniref:uncharacterized protein LOC135098478 n=1 Tax=Scylla paramamosain TaxID=85552 RepID=UPI0030839D87
MVKRIFRTLPERVRGTAPPTCPSPPPPLPHPPRPAPHPRHPGCHPHSPTHPGPHQHPQAARHLHHHPAIPHPQAQEGPPAKTQAPGPPSSHGSCPTAPLSVPLPCPTPAHREESLPASPPREVPPIGGAPVSPGGHDSDDDEPPVLHPPAPEPRPTHHQPHHHIALASCGLHPAHDTSIHAGRDLTPSIPARPYHHSPHTPERPPHAGLFPASRPGQMATQCVAWRPQGVAAATPPRAPRPQTTATAHTPQSAPTCWRLPCFTARPDGYSGCGGCHTPEGSLPPDHCQYHSPVVQYHSSISPPFSRSPPWSPDGGRRASPTGWRSPCYQHHHHHHYTAPPRDRWSPQRSPRRVTVLPALCYPLPGAPLITPRPPCLPGAGPLTPQPLPTLLPAPFPFPGG